MNKLEQLKQFTTVVADTGDLETMKRYQPLDATTNPSLLLKAAASEEYQTHLQQAIAFAKQQGGSNEEQKQWATDKFATLIGKEVTQIIKGRISTEVDARLSFDSKATIEKARRLIDLYEQIGVPRSRIYIKIAATWEGIQAAKVLELEGIQTNITLLFSMEQAKASADVGASLISPFVGRILDWYVQNTETKSYSSEQDPGVQSVRQIYQHYKEQGYNTIVMGASFRNTGQIEALAGCDYLTISPSLLQQLSEEQGELKRVLHADVTAAEKVAAVTEAEFRWALNQNMMANDKLAEGIRNFAKDQEKLEQQLI